MNEEELQVVFDMIVDNEQNYDMTDYEVHFRWFCRVMEAIDENKDKFIGGE